MCSCTATVSCCRTQSQPALMLQDPKAASSCAGVRALGSCAAAALQARACMGTAGGAGQTHGCSAAAAQLLATHVPGTAAPLGSPVHCCRSQQLPARRTPPDPSEAAGPTLTLRSPVQASRWVLRSTNTWGQSKGGGGSGLVGMGGREGWGEGHPAWVSAAVVGCNGQQPWWQVPAPLPQRVDAASMVMLAIAALQPVAELPPPPKHRHQWQAAAGSLCCSLLLALSSLSHPAGAGLTGQPCYRKQHTAVAATTHILPRQLRRWPTSSPLRPKGYPPP